MITLYTPEFENENNIEIAIRKVNNHHIQWPVAIDSGKKIYKRFHMKMWPSIFLFDKKGGMQYQRYGKFKHSELKDVIKTYLDNQNIEFPKTLDEISDGACFL